jgi:hypothetical protein
VNNWWGAEVHPSDFLVHWSERHDTKEFKMRLKELRDAWDLVHSTPELAAAAGVIERWSADLAYSEAAEAEAGASLWPK